MRRFSVLQDKSSNASLASSTVIMPGSVHSLTPSTEPKAEHVGSMALAPSNPSTDIDAESVISLPETTDASAVGHSVDDEDWDQLSYESAVESDDDDDEEPAELLERGGE